MHERRVPRVLSGSFVWPRDERHGMRSHRSCSFLHRAPFDSHFARSLPPDRVSRIAGFALATKRTDRRFAL